MNEARKRKQRKECQEEVEEEVQQSADLKGKQKAECQEEGVRNEPRHAPKPESRRGYRDERMRPRRVPKSKKKLPSLGDALFDNCDLALQDYLKGKPFLTWTVSQQLRKHQCGYRCELYIPLHGLARTSTPLPITTSTDAHDSTMCTTGYYKCRQCATSWLKLIAPCAPGRDLLTCPRFGNLPESGDRAGAGHGQPTYVTTAPLGGRGGLLPARRGTRVEAADCISCGAGGAYDRRLFRACRVTKVGVRVGLGPTRKHKGVDVPCACALM
ncbi:hypothetical protein BJ546DRAFT_591974 [Cryomyces antarcticus]